MWWRKRQLAGTQKFESFRRVLRRSYLWRSFGSLEGLSGLPSNNQGGIQVPWWCNTQLNSIVKFRNENYKRHINSNWRNWWFCVGAPRRPPAPNKELCRHHQVIWCYLRDMIDLGRLKRPHCSTSLGIMVSKGNHPQMGLKNSLLLKMAIEIVDFPIKHGDFP